MTVLLREDVIILYNSLYIRTKKIAAECLSQILFFSYDKGLPL